MINLTPVDSARIVTVIDNYVDLLLDGDERTQRPPLAAGPEIPRDTLLAEHGLCLLIELEADGRQASLLLDAGYSQVGVPHNLDLLGLDLGGVEAVVLSHGHMDHFGALPEVIRRAGKPVPLVMHPGALEGPRYLDIPGVGKLRFPPVEDDELRRAGAELVLSREPYVGPSGMWAATGAIERRTDFETGMPMAVMEKDGQLTHDPIADDQSVVLVVKDKGLVVISGCAHSGIINSVNFARELTGVQQVYAVIGGFHLTGRIFEPIIGRTVEEMQKLEPRVVSPMHCTGYKAINRLRESLGDRFVLNSVGTIINL